MADQAAQLRALNVIDPVLAAVLFVVLIHKLRGLRRDPTDRGRRALTRFFGLTVFSFVLLTPAVYTRVDRWAGVPNLAILPMYVCLIASVVLLQIMLAWWVWPADEATVRVRRRLLLLASVVIVMTAGFFAQRLDALGERPIDVDVAYADHTGVMVFGVACFAAYAVGMADAARLQWRYGSMAEGRPWLRRGLRTAAVSAVIGSAGSVLKVVILVGRWSGWDLGTAVTQANQAVYGLGFLSMGMLAAGWTMTVWGPAVATIAAWPGRYRTYQRLYALWRDCLRSVPRVALDPPRLRWTPVFRHWRLTRPQVEIRDVQLALQPWTDPLVADQARNAAREAGLSSGDQDAVVEAATLRAAMDAAERAAPPRTDLGGELIGMHSGTDDATEVAALLRLARAWRLLPVGTTSEPIVVAGR